MRVCISEGRDEYTGRMMSSGTEGPRLFMRSHSTWHAVSISSCPAASNVLDSKSEDSIGPVALANTHLHAVPQHAVSISSCSAAQNRLHSTLNFKQTQHLARPCQFHPALQQRSCYTQELRQRKHRPGCPCQYSLAFSVSKSFCPEAPNRLNCILNFEASIDKIALANVFLACGHVTALNPVAAKTQHVNHQHEQSGRSLLQYSSQPQSKLRSEQQMTGV